MAGGGLSTFRTVRFGEEEIRYELERKKVKNLNLRIRSDGSVYVSVGASVPVGKADEFVRERGAWILDTQRKFRELAAAVPGEKQYVSGETFEILGRGLRLLVEQGPENQAESDGIYLRVRVKDPEDFALKRRCVERYLDQQCRDVFGEILKELYPQFRRYGVPMPVLRVRKMKTRWGSCLPAKGVVTLNRRLIEAPRGCVESVIAHELCHFVYPNHSAQFYRFLSMFLPDWKERKQILDQNYAARLY